MKTRLFLILGISLIVLFGALAALHTNNPVTEKTSFEKELLTQMHDPLTETQSG